jgi:hypothetical protein
MLEEMRYRSFLGSRYVFGQYLGLQLLGWAVFSGCRAVVAGSINVRVEQFALLIILLFAAYWWNFRLAMEIVLHPDSLAVTTMTAKPIVQLADLTSVRRGWVPIVIILERRTGRSFWIPRTARMAPLVETLQNDRGEIWVSP